jgi:signal transduction histidine kinase
MKLFSKINSFFSPGNKSVRFWNSYNIIQMGTLIGLFIFIFIPIFLPQYFSWISNLKIYLYALLWILAINILLFLLVKIFKKESFWIYAGYFWAIAYIMVIYSTGGLDGSFIFVLLFIPIISVSQLDLKLTRNNSIWSFALLLILFFTKKQYFTDPSHITKFLFVFACLILLNFFIYEFVKEIITQKYEKELFKRKFTELSELDDVKQMFLTAMSHQLRTPLAGARWALDTVVKDPNCPNKEILKQGYEKIVQSIGIVSELLKSAESDIEKGKMKIEKKRLDLGILLKKVSENLNYLAVTNSISLSLDIASGIFLNGDEKMLDLAFTNIFDNAFRYSPKGKVKISLKKENNQAKVMIEDSGIGIDSADMEYVFQKFFRGKNALKLDPNESGVGLYATKKIIEMHNGNINISSVIGKGTKVEVSLPLD